MYRAPIYIYIYRSTDIIYRYIYTIVYIFVYPDIYMHRGPVRSHWDQGWISYQTPFRPCVDCSILNSTTYVVRRS